MRRRRRAGRAGCRVRGARRAPAARAALVGPVQERHQRVVHQQPLHAAAARLGEQRATVSAADRCPLASSRSCSATTSSTSCQSGRSEPSVADHVDRAQFEPAVHRQFRAGRAGLVVRADTVGIHTTRPPSRAATSTASGFAPPTGLFSTTPPYTPSPAIGGPLDGAALVRLEHDRARNRRRARRRTVCASSPWRGSRLGAAWTCRSTMSTAQSRQRRASCRVRPIRGRDGRRAGGAAPCRRRRRGAARRPARRRPDA